MTGDAMPLLSVRKLSVAFGTPRAHVLAVDGVSFDVNSGECLALVGESGSGKSVTALSLMRLLLMPPAFHPQGEILFMGADVLKLPQAKMRALRGKAMTMVFQEPMSALNPLQNVERQIGEALELHTDLNRRARRERVLDLLDEVGIDNPKARLMSLPHELSGGQRQRVMIAMALANRPALLIADEPTTALDVTVQAQILDLLAALREKHKMAMVFITHDLSIVRRMADRVCVMRYGRIVEEGAARAVFQAPRHAYTKLLIDAEPGGKAVLATDAAPVLLEARHLKISFALGQGFLGGLLPQRADRLIKAVDDVSFSLQQGKTLGIVGESGSGKTTLGLAVLRLIKAQGEIVFDGRVISGLSAKMMRPLRRHMQIVFQDPYGALSPRLSAEQIIAEGLQIAEPALTRAQLRARVAAAMADTGLEPSLMDRFPHEFSGGQRQRIAIARALVLNPKLIVLDEPTSALDRSIQAQIVDLLARLQAERGLTYLFISHDLRVVRALAHDVLVMRSGVVVERGRADDVFAAPVHPYTQALFAAAF